MSRNVGPGATNPIPNSYVRELAYVADVQHGDGLVQCAFGDLVAPAVSVVLGQPMSVGVASQAEWGQNVFVVSGTDETINVHGYDYLGQPMVEEMVVTGGSATGAKAFKWVTRIAGTVGDQSLAWGDQYGLPYAMKSEDTADTGTAADQTTPSATTGDPRGTVQFATPPDGATEKLFTYTPFRPEVDGIKSMHGLRHYYPASP